jgi:hypothetical protein
MATVVDICNLALAHIGDRANITSIDPPEGSVQAEHCARFYPMARDSLLNMHPWAFASKRVALADISLVIVPPDKWQYSYAAPGDFMKILGVYDPNAMYDESKSEFEFELAVGVGGNTRVLYCNAEGAIARYVALINDSATFPPLFVEGLAWLLASYLAGPIIKGTEGMNVAGSALQMAMSYVQRARAEDANQRNRASVRRDTRHTPSWIANRGSLWPYEDDPWYPSGN